MALVAAQQPSQWAPPSWQWLAGEEEGGATLGVVQGPLGAAHPLGFPMGLSWLEGLARRALEGWQAPAACHALGAALPPMLALQGATALGAMLAFVLVRAQLSLVRALAWQPHPLSLSLRTSALPLTHSLTSLSCSLSLSLSLFFRSQCSSSWWLRLGSGRQHLPLHQHRHGRRWRGRVLWRGRRSQWLRHLH